MIAGLRLSVLALLRLLDPDVQGHAGLHPSWVTLQTQKRPIPLRTAKVFLYYGDDFARELVSALVSREVLSKERLSLQPQVLSEGCLSLQSHVV